MLTTKILLFYHILVYVSLIRLGRLQNIVPYIPSENKSLSMTAKSKNILFYTESRLKIHLGYLTASGISRPKLSNKTQAPISDLG